MGYGARRWLTCMSAVAVAGAWAFGQVGVANAEGTAPSVPRASAGVRALATGMERAGQYTSAAKILAFGMRGPAVKALQQRLHDLHYYVGKVDGYFGWDTLEGVWAFKEVQSGKIEPRNANIVGPFMQHELLHPRLPKVLHPDGGKYLRIEINKKIEVLVLYNHNKVELITHVSSGGGYTYCTGSGCYVAVTPDGHYKALSFLAGNITVPLGQMYNPVFFIGTAYAIHGEPNGGVPLYPASHGCVRIPWDLATFFHKLIKIVSINGRGTPIWING